VPHRERRELDGRTPVHVTLRLLPEIKRLRRRGQYRAIRQALSRTAHRRDCRICQYSVQGNHLHLVVEPSSKEGLRRGMMSFKSSCAKRLNGVVARHGRVFADRYHVRYLDTPAQVRRALSYVLNNWRRHREDRNAPWRFDPFSSADLFDGWTDRHGMWTRPEGDRPVAASRFWLLTKGWRRHGTIRAEEVPGAA
jgi:REP element-mobilizing transposase RayT